MVKKFEPQTSKPVVDYAFDILSVVAEPKFSMSPTLWGFVYDVQNSRIYFRTAANGKLSQIDFTAFDFSCTTPVKALDINTELGGDVTGSFVDYTNDMTREMLETVVRLFPDFKDTITDEYIDFVATYPEKYTHCTE